MLNIEYRLKLGQDEFIIRGDYKNAKEFFNSMSFFSSLPKTAPGGATDLKLVVRETKKGTYYSLVSEQEKMEFTLGQHKEGDTLYAKEWKPLFGAGSAQEEDGGGYQPQSASPIMVGQQQPAQQQQMIQHPVIPQVPQQQFVAPAQVAMPQVQQVVQPQVQQQVIQQPVQPQVQQQQVVTPAAPNPQVAAVASNVLSRFGIKN